jgi:hypothetical protein
VICDVCVCWGPRSIGLFSRNDISAIILANIHDIRTESEGAVDDSPDAQSASSGTPANDATPAASEDTPTTLLANATKHQNVSPADLCRVLSSTMTRYPATGTTPKKSNDADLIVVSSKKYRSVNATDVRYSISAHRSSKSGALVDRGANGGDAGDDVRIIFKTGRHVDVQGIDDYQIVDIPIVACGGVISTQRGPVIAIMHQYVYTGKGKTIHSCGQLEWYKNDVNDKSIKVPGGLQRIQTNDSYAIPINVKDGLPYVQVRPYTDEEWDSHLTARAMWTGILRF